MELLSGLYSEVGETDFIEEFKETDQFADHIAVMFGGEERAPWDQVGRYTSTYIVLYPVPVHHTYCPRYKSQSITRTSLLSWSVFPPTGPCEAITSKRFILNAGYPAFIILVQDSKAHEDFLTIYCV